MGRHTPKTNAPLIEAEALAQRQTQATATSGKTVSKKPAATGGSKTKVPHIRQLEKPPKVSESIEWVQSGAGWACREIYYVAGRRRRRVLGHLGRKRYDEMCANASAAELAQRLSDWIEERKFEKGLAEMGGEAEQRPVM